MRISALSADVRCGQGRQVPADLPHDLRWQVAPGFAVRGLVGGVVAVEGELVAQPVGRPAWPGRAELPGRRAGRRSSRQRAAPPRVATLTTASQSPGTPSTPLCHGPRMASPGIRVIAARALPQTGMHLAHTWCVPEPASVAARPGAGAGTPGPVRSILALTCTSAAQVHCGPKAGTRSNASAGASTASPPGWRASRRAHRQQSDTGLLGYPLIRTILSLGQ